MRLTAFSRRSAFSLLWVLACGGGARELVFAPMLTREDESKLDAGNGIGTRAAGDGGGERTDQDAGDDAEVLYSR